MEFYKNIFLLGENNTSRSNSFGFTFLCGALSGLNAITITFPLDVARTRLSINTPNSTLKETGLFRTLIYLLKNEGIKGVYKGYSFAFIVNLNIFFNHEIFVNYLIEITIINIIFFLI